MERTPLQGCSKAIFRPETKGQDQCAQSLHAEAAGDDHLLQLHNTFHIRQAQGLCHDHPLLETHFSTQRKHHHGCDGHKAQTADLNQCDNNRLTESAPLHERIKQHKTGHTGSGSSGKQRRKEAAAFTATGRNRQRKQQRAHQNNGSKHHGNGFCCIQWFAFAAQRMAQPT